MGLSRNGVVVSCFVMLSAIGLAEVQWLRYRTSPNVGEELSASVSRYYRQFEKSRPSDVPSPAFKTDRPLFIKWNNSMDERGYRWIAMDRSTSQGLYDLMYVDVDGDGSLDDETPVKGRQSEQYTVYFDPVAVYLKGDDGPVTYHLSCEFYSYNEQSTYLMISSGSYYEGAALIDGKLVPCALVDYNTNGTFDDKAENFDADRIVLGSERDRKTFHVGNYLEYGDTLYRVKIARDGAFVELTPASDVAWGIVNVPLSITKFTVGGLNGMYEKTPKEGRVRLPEGTYRVNEWQIDRKDKGQNWTLSGSGFPRQTAFNVSSDTPVTMDVGEPVFSQLSVNESQGVFAVNQQLRGKQGESISLLRNGSRPAAPKVNIRSKTGEYDRTFSLEYG
jgi:hypothetical protein